MRQTANKAPKKQTKLGHKQQHNMMTLRKILTHQYDEIVIGGQQLTISIFSPQECNRNDLICVSWLKTIENERNERQKKTT